MAYTSEYKRRRRIAKSHNTEQKIKGSRIEHAEAENSRCVNEEVINGTYIRRESGRTRFAPIPQRMHFSPTSMPTYDEMQTGAPVLHSDSQV